MNWRDFCIVINATQDWGFDSFPALAMVYCWGVLVGTFILLIKAKHIN